MRARINWIVAIAMVLAMSASGRCVSAGLTAFSVPSTPSSTTWTEVSSGWVGPIKLTNDPVVTFQTVTATGGMRWQGWGTFVSGIPHGITASNILSTEMNQGDTFRFGLDAKSGSFRLVDLAPNNSFSEAMIFSPGLTTYGYSDGVNTGVDTGVPIGPIDVQITWSNRATGDYSGKITAIGGVIPLYTWNGQFEQLGGADGLNHVNGYVATNLGDSTNYFGLRYLEVGSGVLPDPATLVPEPELVAFFPLIIGGILIRRRR